MAASVFLGCAIFGGISATKDGEPFVGGAAAVLFAGGAAWCCLTARSGVLVSEAGVIVRRYLQDRAVSWDEVISFGLRNHRSILGERLSKPSMTLRSGEVIKLIGVEPLGRPFGVSSKPVHFEQLDELDRLARGRLTQWAAAPSRSRPTS